MIKKFLKRVGIFLLAAIFVISVIGFCSAGISPDSAEEVIKVSYEQKGNYAFQTYNRPKDFSGGNIFLPITESAQMVFAYSFSADDEKSPLRGKEKTVSVKAVISNLDGKWSKEITLLSPKKESSDDIRISFPLDLKSVLGVGIKIDKELNPKYDSKVQFYSASSSYRLSVIATVVSGDRSFSASVGGKIDDAALSWDDQNFEGASRGSGYWDLYGFGYEAKLLPNSLMGSKSIKRDPAISEPVLLADTAPVIMSGSEAVDAVIRYELSADKKITDMKVTGIMELEGASPSKWKRVIEKLEFKKDGENKFEVLFPIDLDALRSEIDAVDNSLDYRPSQSVDLILRTRILVEANIGGFPVSEELYLDSFSGKVNGDIMVWSAGTQLVKPGTVKKMEEVRSGWMIILLRISPFSALISLCLLLFFFSGYWERRPKMGFFEKCEEERRKNKNSFARSQKAFSIDAWPTDKVFSVGSLDDLLNVALNNGGTVLFFENKDAKSVTYWVVEKEAVYLYDHE